MKVARAFSIASAAIAVLLGGWATVSALFLGDQAGGAFALALVLWAVSGLPILIAGLVIHALRARRTSMAMPSHLPDWKRR